nr:phospholipase-like protein [Tanacetum cinerariifolium]
MAWRFANSRRKARAVDIVAGAIVPRAVATSQRQRRTYEQFQAMTNQEAEGSGSSIKRTRTYILREREEAEQRPLEDYFGNDDTPLKYSKENKVSERINALSRNSIGLILKITSAIRQLAYGTAPDAYDEEEFCLVSGLKFGVENSTDYNKAKDPIPFRRRVFSSNLDGRPIRGKDVELLIESDVFKKLDENDAVSLCCVGILQLVLLGVKDRHPVPNWILRLANDRVSWDNYPWGSYVWPTLYKHLRDANVKHWQPLYASDPTNETDTKSYSIKGFAWAFKTWILESFRAATDDYYTRYRRHPRIVAWSSKHKFYRHLLKPMLHGQLHVERLVLDETEARSRWWVSSRAYFDGRNFEYEQIPRHLNRNNYFEVPSEMYLEFEEQIRGYQQMKEKNDDMYEKMTRFMEDMRRVP